MDIYEQDIILSFFGIGLGINFPQSPIHQKAWHGRSNVLGIQGRFRTLLKAIYYGLNNP